MVCVVPAILAVIWSANFRGGWALVLAGFLSGAILGLGFHRESFLGGYASLRRRMLRLGHIALVALGALNVLFAISVPVATDRWPAEVASRGLFSGAVLMPAVCFLTAWKQPGRHLFVVPVLMLAVAVACIVFGL